MEGVIGSGKLKGWRSSKLKEGVYVGQGEVRSKKGAAWSDSRTQTNETIRPTK